MGFVDIKVCAVDEVWSGLQLVIRKALLDAKVASYGSLMYLTPGQVTVKFVPQGTSTVLTQVTFQAAADGTYKAQVVIEK